MDKIYLVLIVFYLIIGTFISNGLAKKSLIAEAFIIVFWPLIFIIIIVDIFILFIYYLIRDIIDGIVNG